MPRRSRPEFAHVASEKTRQAAAAPIERLSTIFDRKAGESVRPIGNAWSRTYYGGDFSLFVPPAGATAVSLVFVQSKNGNTGGNPGALGGGATDEHLLYAGLSRVAADAVLAGAGSVPSAAVFSVWHPELVALRASLNLPRHPSQIVVSQHARFDFTALLFNVPAVPVYVIAEDAHMARHASALGARPWIRHIPLEGDALGPAIDRLRSEAGVQRISAIGGRATATRLVDAGLAQDLYLTTTSRDGGEPDTPWYSGSKPPPLRTITQKQWNDSGSRIRFEHILIGARG
jgi:riboflavin biosynthesis pyrimidine reductase